MRENGAICAFLLSILVFSSFTPFAYAFGGDAAPQAAVVDMGVAGDALELQDAECSTNMITVKEYQNLLRIANESIEFIGNKQAELDAQEKAKRGITPEAPGAKGRMVMGNDKPIAIQEVVGREAVLQNGTCFLKNSVIRGRLAYAALLDRQYRVCPNATNPSCQGGAINPAEKEDLVKRLEQYRKSLTDAMNKTDAEAEIERQRGELADIGFSPLNYMVTDSGYLQVASNGGSIFLLPKTLETFINWMKGWETWDKLAGWVAIAGLGVGVAQIAKGGIKYLKIAGEPGGPGTFFNELRSFFTRAKDLKLYTAKFKAMAPADVRQWAKELLKEFGNADEELDKITKIAKKIKDGTATENDIVSLNERLKRLEQIRDAHNTRGMTDAQIYKEIDDFLTKPDIGGVRQIDGLGVRGVITAEQSSSFLAKIAEDTTLPTSIRDIATTQLAAIPEKAKFGNPFADIVMQEAKRLAALTPPDMRAVNAINNLKNLDSFKWITERSIIIENPEAAAKKMVELLSDARETSIALDAASATYVVTPPIRGTTLSTAGVSNAVFGSIGSIFGFNRFYKSTDIIRRALGSGFGWAAAQTLVLESFQILTNNMIRKPVFETQGLQFDMNKVRAEGSSYFQIDVVTPFTRSDALPRNWIFDTFTAYGLREAIGKDTSAERKLQEIGNYVYIHDTASLPKLGEEDAIAIITEANISDYGKREMILSRTPNRLFFLAFEHPQTYIDDWTAMAFETHDINLFALTDQVSSWALTPYEDGMKFLGSTAVAFGASAIVGNIVGGVLKGGRMVWFLKAATIAGIYSVSGITPKITQESKQLFQGQLVDVKRAKESTTLCSKALADKQFVVSLAQTTMYASLLASFVPIPIVGIPATAVNIIATYWGSDQISGAIKALHECTETDFRIVAVKKSSTQAVQDNVLSGLARNPATKSIMETISTATPGIAKEINQAISETQEQTLNLRGELGGTVTRVLPDKTYYVYLYRAAIDWFKLGMGCDMQLCGRNAAGDIDPNTCISITESKIIDSKGNVVLEKEHVRGFRIDREMRYAYLPQKVINVKIGNGKKILEVDSSGVSISGCLKSEVKSLLKTSSEDLLKRSFGRLDAIATKEAAVLFDNNKNLQVQFLEPYCDQNAGSWISIPNGKAEIYADAAGTVKVPGLKDKTDKECDLHMPVRSAASFENALVMPSLDGQQYHIIIYSLTDAQKEAVEGFKINGQCSLEDGTPGIKLSAAPAGEDLKQQWGELLKDVCMTQIRGQQNEMVTFEKGADGKDYMNVVDAAGKTRRYEVIGYGTTMCKDSMEVSDIETNVRQCFRGYKDQNGVPTYGFYDKEGRQIGAPIPMFWSNGLGGMMLYDRETGKISIQNEFPFSMNPAFNSLGMMSTPYGTGFAPGLPPGGNPNAGRGGGGAVAQPNLLASLPWTPEGPELVIFLLSIAGMLIAIRIRNPGRKRR